MDDKGRIYYIMTVDMSGPEQIILILRQYLYLQGISHQITNC